MNLAIMDNFYGGQTNKSNNPVNQPSYYQNSANQQRQTAAEIARRQVLSTYSHSEKKNHLPPTAKQIIVKDQDWYKYHTAWQKYYQNYYNDYYSQAAQNYLEQSKLKTQRIASGKVRKKHNRKILIPIITAAFLVLTILFLQYNRLIFAPIMAYVSPSNNVPTSIEAIDPNVAGAVSPEPRLIIPKLNVDVPIAFDIPNDQVMSAMNHGVAQFSIPGANAMPGEVGNLAISGHSAGDIYSNNPYKFIFSGLERLAVGDLIYVNYNSIRYTYQMTGSETVEPTNVKALVYETDKPILTLITCTPLGTSRYRLLISAEQISPSYESTTVNSDTTHDGANNAEMPANEPSFFESLFQ